MIVESWSVELLYHWKARCGLVHHTKSLHFSAVFLMLFKTIYKYRKMPNYFVLKSKRISRHSGFFFNVMLFTHELMSVEWLEISLLLFYLYVQARWVATFILITAHVIRKMTCILMQNLRWFYAFVDYELSLNFWIIALSNAQHHVYQKYVEMVSFCEPESDISVLHQIAFYYVTLAF